MLTYKYSELAKSVLFKKKASSLALTRESMDSNTHREKPEHDGFCDVLKGEEMWWNDET